MTQAATVSGVAWLDTFGDVAALGTLHDYGRRGSHERLPGTWRVATAPALTSSSLICIYGIRRSRTS